MLETRAKEAPLLKKRIAALKHVEALLHPLKDKPIAKMDRTKLLTHVNGIVEESNLTLTKRNNVFHFSILAQPLVAGLLYSKIMHVQGIEIPFDIRLQLLHRYSEDFIQDMMDAEQDKDFDDSLRKWLKTISIWSKPEGNITEVNMTFRWVLGCMTDSLQYQLQFKGKDHEEWKTETNKNVEAKGKRGHIPGRFVTMCRISLDK